MCTMEKSKYGLEQAFPENKPEDSEYILKLRNPEIIIIYSSLSGKESQKITVVEDNTHMHARTHARTHARMHTHINIYNIYTITNTQT